MKEVWIKAYRSPEYKKVLVDDEDYQKVAELSWHENKDGYAVRRDFRNEFGMGIQKTILMHRQILNVVTSTDHDYCVDHINGNRLDNRKENLRIVTLSVNSSNRHVVKASTGMLGVTEQHGRFIARARRDNIPRYLGSFDTVEEAKNAIELFDEFGLMKGKKKLVAVKA